MSVLAGLALVTVLVCCRRCARSYDALHSFNALVTAVRSSLHSFTAIMCSWLCCTALMRLHCTTRLQFTRERSSLRSLLHLKLCLSVAVAALNLLVEAAFNLLVEAALNLLDKAALNLLVEAALNPLVASIDC